MTDAEHAESTALVSVFPEADTLMCFFHVIKAAEDKLSGNKDRRCDIEGCRIAKRCETMLVSTAVLANFIIYIRLKFLF
jgi:hypothetical protein